MQLVQPAKLATSVSSYSLFNISSNVENISFASSSRTGGNLKSTVAMCKPSWKPLVKAIAGFSRNERAFFRRKLTVCSTRYGEWIESWIRFQRIRGHVAIVICCISGHKEGRKQQRLTRVRVCYLSIREENRTRDTKASGIFNVAQGTGNTSSSRLCVSTISAARRRRRRRGRERGYESS